MLNPSEIACKRQINKLRYTSCDLELGNFAKLIILENRFGRKMMKYPILVHEFSFNKIKNGSRKVGVHLLDKKSQQVKLHDILEMHNRANGEVIECEVKGIAIFDNFKDLVEALSPQALGYDSEEEVLIRLNRMYSIDLQRELNAVAFFIAPSFVNMRRLDRGALERE